MIVRNALAQNPSEIVAVGVDELDQEKLTPLVRLQYHDSIADAVADLGRPDEIGRVFSGFQKYPCDRAAWAESASTLKKHAAGHLSLG